MSQTAASTVLLAPTLPSAASGLDSWICGQMLKPEAIEVVCLHLVDIFKNKYLLFDIQYTCRATSLNFGQ